MDRLRRTFPRGLDADPRPTSGEAYALGVTIALEGVPGAPTLRASQVRTAWRRLPALDLVRGRVAVGGHLAAAIFFEEQRVGWLSLILGASHLIYELLRAGGRERAPSDPSLHRCGPRPGPPRERTCYAGARERAMTFSDEDGERDADGPTAADADAEAEAPDGVAGLTPPRRRGRQPNRWPADLGPDDLEGYRQRFGLSEQKLADYLGASVPTLRSWTKGGKAPTAERHGELRARLAQDYVAPPTEGPPRRRGRPPGSIRVAPAAERPPARQAEWPAEAAADDHEPSFPAAEAPLARAGSTAQAIVELAAAYLRTPGGQQLTPSELVALLERVRRTVE